MIEIIPLQKAKFVNNQKTIRVPGSKSYTNRALLLAALARGKSVLVNPLESDDTATMIGALKQLGIKIEKKRNAIEVHGNGGQFLKPKKTLNLANAGTAMRFLTAALATCDFTSRLNGDKRMRQRPVADLADALKNLGADITTTRGCPPVTIRGGLRGGSAYVRGAVSSQFLSALLMATPYAGKPTILRVRGRLTSLFYVKMTLSTMKKFGVKVHRENYKKFFIRPKKYRAVRYVIEGDASSASYFFATAAIGNIAVTVKNMDVSSKQADVNFLTILKKMGCRVTSGKNHITVAGPKELQHAGTLNLNKLPDAAMTAAIVAAFARGKSKLTGIGNLRIKETDRLKALSSELTKIGVEVKEGNDFLEISGNPDALQSAVIETYNDHRMAMCFAVAGSKIPGIKIKNPGCVTKTYPDFWTDLAKIGVASIKIKQPRDRNIILGGLRGTGKSIIGKAIAEKLGYQFIDTDMLIEQRAGKKIAAMVKEDGWPHFRKLEAGVAKELDSGSKTVIATGGGMLANEKNAAHLKKNAVVVLLTSRPETAANRIRRDKNRPPLTNQRNLISELKQLWNERKHQYLRAADLVFDTSEESANIKADAAKKAAKILDLLHGRAG